MVQWLSGINDYRAIHQAPPLVWNLTLASLAQRWTDFCVFQHENDQYGENIALGYPTIKQVIDAWYNEVSLYDYNNPGFYDNTGHFTQLVWVGTTQLGCATTKCPSYLLYDCKFYPPGNFAGHFAANVLP